MTFDAMLDDARSEAMRAAGLWTDRLIVDCLDDFGARDTSRVLPNL